MAAIAAAAAACLMLAAGASATSERLRDIELSLQEFQDMVEDKE